MPALDDRIAAVRARGAVRDLVDRAIEVRLLDSALALASRLFVAVIPMALLVTSLVPGGQTFADRVVAGLHLSGAGRAAVEQLFATPETVRAGITAATCIVLAYSLTSCAGVLQRTYRAAWLLEAAEGAGWRAETERRLLWAAGLVVYIGVTFTLADAGGSGVMATVRDVARTALALAFFGWTPYVLLGRRIAPRRLLPTAVLGAGALGTVTVIAPIYVPRLASASAESYGLVGFAFTFLTLLYAHAILIVAAAVSGAVLARRRIGRARAGAASGLARP